MAAAVAASADLPVAGAVSAEMADQDVVFHLTVEMAAAAAVTVAEEVVWAAEVADTTVADDSNIVPRNNTSRYA